MTLFSKMQPPAWALAVVDRLNEAGYQAWFVGGCVRDSLLGRIPQDWDITTSALPHQTAALFPSCVQVPGALRHGTVTVLWENHPCEVTTFRAEEGGADHRHPDTVRFVGTLREDLSRRDFTVNAMAWHPERGLVDAFGGQEDLAQGIIRTVGDPEQRFGEDALRILRAVRFAAQLDFCVEPNTAQAAQRLAGTLNCVSPERIYAELNKLLMAPAAGRVLAEHPAVVQAVLPGAGACPESLSAAPADLPLRWALALQPLSGDGAAALFARLKADKATAQAACQLLQYREELLLLEPISLRRWLARLGPMQTRRLLLLQGCEENTAAQAVAKAESGVWSLAQLAVNGNDLLAYGQGREVGRLLNALLEQVMEEKLPNRRPELLARAAEYAKK